MTQHIKAKEFLHDKYWIYANFQKLTDAQVQAPLAGGVVEILAPRVLTQTPSHPPKFLRIKGYAQFIDFQANGNGTLTHMEEIEVLTSKEKKKSNIAQSEVNGSAIAVKLLKRLFGDYTAVSAAMVAVTVQGGGGWVALLSKEYVRVALDRKGWLGHEQVNIVVPVGGLQCLGELIKNKQLWGLKEALEAQIGVKLRYVCNPVAIWLNTDSQSQLVRC